MKQRPAIGFRPSVRTMQEQSEKAQDFYAAMSGKPRPEFKPLKPKQVRAKAGANGKITESVVLAAIINVLRMHKNVAVVERVNSGTAVNATGAFVKFHTVYAANVRKVDLDVQLKNGIRVVIEVKRPGWKKPTNSREEDQARYIEMMKAAGCRGCFATGILDVMPLLD